MDIPTSRTGILTGFLSEAELAAELGCFERTLARWRGLRIGPPFAMKGREPIYETKQRAHGSPQAGPRALHQARKPERAEASERAR